MCSLQIPQRARVVSRNEFEKLLALAEQRNLLILFDAALSKGIYDTTAGPDFSTGLAERVILIGSLSKWYRMSGWRIGWIAGSAAHLKPLRDLKQALSICSASISQWAALAALTGPQEWLDEQQAEFVLKRDLVLGALRANKISFVQPDSAFYLWLDIRPSGLSSNEFAAVALHRARVQVTPGTEFGAAGEGFARISLAPSAGQLTAAMERIQKAIGELTR